MLINVFAVLAYILPPIAAVSWAKARKSRDLGITAHFASSVLLWLALMPYVNSTLPMSAYIYASVLSGSMMTVCFYIPGCLIFRGWQKHAWLLVAAGISLYAMDVIVLWLGRNQ